MECSLNESVKIGMHTYAKQKIKDYFTVTQQEIVEIFSSHWYVSKADQIRMGNSKYNYILIKALSHIADLFNLSAEIIVVFCDYETFEPRTFDAFENIQSRLEAGRTENLCGVLVSKDDNIESSLLKYNSGKETRIIVSYSYNELLNNKSDNYIFRSKLQSVFYNRDLFAFDDALKTDKYFFGRDQIVMDIINRHLTDQNTGLFGLRKTGKTSILYEVQRKIQLKNSYAVFVSCQSPEMSTGTWVDSIYYVVKQIYETVDLDVTALNRKEYNNLTATDMLLNTIDYVESTKHKKILIMFDEIEHITFGKAAAPNWGQGLESVSFWKSMRSAFQKQKSHFTYCIVGTNPVCIEYPTIGHTDNPIFMGVTPLYVPGFDISQTRGMVRKLGKIMGIRFEETLYSKMTEDFGGHPFLIRHLCSFISSKNLDRPVTITRVQYNECKDDFNKTQSKYFDMLLEVLIDFYPLEYEMLKYLAIGDMDTFRYFASEDPTMIQHLAGYGIITCTGNDYDFKIDAIKEYLIRKENMHQKLQSKEDKWNHLCNKRGNFEIEMRRLVKHAIFINDPKGAKEYVVSKIYNAPQFKKKYQDYEYNDLFDPQKSNIYLKSITVLITGKWEIFQPFMVGMNQEDFKHAMDVLNCEGRFDAHAKIPNDNDITLFDATINKLSKIIDEYNKLLS